MGIDDLVNNGSNNILGDVFTDMVINSLAGEATYPFIFKLKIPNYSSSKKISDFNSREEWRKYLIEENASFVEQYFKPVRDLLDSWNVEYKEQKTLRTFYADLNKDQAKQIKSADYVSWFVANRSIK